MKKAIVTTTIHSPTKALKKFAEIADRDEWKLFIVGDKKTPHKEYAEFCQKYESVYYLAPAEQQAISKELSDLIGWNCIQRRNFGLIAAYNWGADIIATIDDDNIPYDAWGKNCKVNTEYAPIVYETNAPVFDPLSPTHPALWHRGFPIQLLDDRQYARGPMTKRKVLVQADFWDGDPDVDAVARITLAPRIEFSRNIASFSSNKIMPFNSQNTFLSRDIFPTYFLFPHIGRMDDIWAAYMTQHQFPESVIFSKASVFQERNIHDLSKDLEQEMIGYKHSQDIATKPDAYRTLMPAETLKAYAVYKELFK